jgi:hypothetical protein
MPTAVVTIICIALVVLGGMAMSQGILTSADTAAFSVDGISTREGDITRTEINTLRAETLSWSDLLRVTVNNGGQTKLTDFDKWDFIVHYSDSTIAYDKWLPYTDGVLNNDEWRKVRIGLDGPNEYFEPEILNPEEDLVILAKLNPLPQVSSAGVITIASPNGVENSVSFSKLSYTLLVPHSENTTIAGTRYYQVAESAAADVGGLTETTDVFHVGESARKMMHQENDSSRPAAHVFSLTGITQIPSATWTAYYRCRSIGMSNVEDDVISFNINILVRKADGTLRETLATDVAGAFLTGSELNTWLTKSAVYDFPGYTVVDNNDYLEIDYYGKIAGGASDTEGSLQIRVDDNTLAGVDQTRITA